MRFLIAALLSFSAVRGATIVDLITMMSKCGPGAPAIVAWNGKGFICAQLGAGLSMDTTGHINVTIAAGPPLAPQWTVENISLSGVVPDSSGNFVLNYTTQKLPNNGVVWYWFRSANPMLSSEGIVAWTGSPLQIVLPAGTSTTDSVVIAYQFQ